MYTNIVSFLLSLINEALVENLKSKRMASFGSSHGKLSINTPKWQKLKPQMLSKSKTFDNTKDFTPTKISVSRS